MKLTPTTRRVLTALAAIALLAGGGLIALYLAARPLRPLAASHPPEAMQTHPRELPDLPSVFMSDDVLTPTGAQLLAGLPLEMPIYGAPGVVATKLVAYEREDRELGEQVAVVHFKNVDVAAIRAYYHDQAYRLGFMLQTIESDSGNRIYTRDGQVLLVRVREAEPPRSSEGLWLTILLRYTERR